MVVIVACSFWSICFLLGLAFYDASVRSVISACIYAWIARRLLREAQQ